MTRADCPLSEADQQRLATARTAAEMKTRAEILPVVATVSGRYERAEDVVGLWGGLVGLAVVWLAYPREHLEPGSWASRPLWLELACLLAAVIAGFALGTFLASRIDCLRRLLISKKQMHEEVLARAHDVFFHRRSHRGTTGCRLLLYVSLFERVAAVVADGTVLEKLGPNAVDELCARLTQALGRDGVTEALCALIDEAGQRLAVVLPRGEDQVKEPDTTEPCILLSGRPDR